MADGIDIVVRDRIQDSIQAKIAQIGVAAETSHLKVEQLKRSLNFGGLNLGIKNTGLNNVDIALAKLQEQYHKTAIAATRSFEAQENALNRMIATEQRAFQAQEKRATEAVRNQQKIQKAVAETSAATIVANNKARASQAALFTAQQNGYTAQSIANTRLAREREATAAASRRIFQEEAARTLRLADLQVMSTQRVNAARAASAASIVASNSRAAASVNAVIAGEQRLVAALDQSSRAYKSMAAAGLAAEATNNRLVASQQRLAAPTAIVARHTSTLSKAQHAAALRANELAISNARAATAANRLRIAEVQLERALNSVNNTARRTKNSLDEINNIRFTNLQNSIGRTNGLLQRFESRASKTARSIRTLASVVFLAGTGAQVLENLDAPQKIMNTLGVASRVDDIFGDKDGSKTLERQNELFRQLFLTAQDARAPLTSLTDNFLKYDNTLRDLGYGQEKTIEVLGTLSKSLGILGSDASEVNAVMTQLGDTFASRRLNGDELRSLKEKMPLLMEALKDVVGGSYQELQRLADKQMLSIDLVIKAIERMTVTASVQFAGTTRTIGQAITQLKNQILKTFKEMDQKFGITTKIIELIDVVKNNLPTVIRLFKSFGVTVAGVLGSAALAKLTGIGPLLKSAFVSISTAMTAGPVALLTLPNLFGAIASSAGSLASVLPLVAGYFAYFSDTIKVTSDGVTTLNDLIGGLIKTFKDMVAQSGVSSIFGDFFTAEGAQKNFDLVRGIFDYMVDKALQFAAIIKTSFDVLKTFNWEGFWKGVAEIPALLTAAIRNAIISLFQFLVSDAAPFFQNMWDNFVHMGKTAIASMFKSMSASLMETGGWIAGSFGKAFGTVGRDIEAGLNTEFAQNDPQLMVAQLEALKSKTEEVAPVLTGLWAFTKESFASNVETMKTKYGELTETILANTAKSTEARLKADRMINDANRPNQEALRQTDLQKLKEMYKEMDQVASASDKVSLNMNAAEKAIAGASDIASVLKKEIGQVDQQSVLMMNNTAQGLEMIKEAARFDSFDTGDVIGQTITEGSREADNAISRLATSAIENFQSMKDAAISVGVAISQMANAQQQFNNVPQPQFTGRTNDFVGSYTQFAQGGIGSFGRSQQGGGSLGSGLPEGWKYEKAATSGIGLMLSGPSAADLRFGSFNARYTPGQFNRNPRGYASGGYTGNGSRNSVAGVVHGKEFVMPADATKRYRPMLEAMRSGKVGSGGEPAAVGIKVNIENYGSSTHTVQQISENEIRIIARETVQREASNVVARDLNNPNSSMSKSINANLRTGRRR